MKVLKQNFVDLPEIYGQIDYRLVLVENGFQIHTVLTMWRTETIKTITDVGYSIDNALAAYNSRVGI